MKGSWTAVSLVTLCAATASVAAPLPPRPAPRTLDHLRGAGIAAVGKDADRKVSTRLRAAERWGGPRAAGLVAADPPRSPDGKLEVYLDCATLGAEQLAALANAGVTVEAVEAARGR